MGNKSRIEGLYCYSLITIIGLTSQVRRLKLLKNCQNNSNNILTANFLIATFLTTIYAGTITASINKNTFLIPMALLLKALANIGMQMRIIKTGNNSLKVNILPK